MLRILLIAFLVVTFSCTTTQVAVRKNVEKRVKVRKIEPPKLPSTFEYPEDIALESIEEKIAEQALLELEKKLSENEAFKKVVGEENATAGEPEEKEKNDIIVYNDKVEYFIRYFQTKGRKSFTKWLARSEKYVPIMKEVLKKHGLPEDLVYLAMIESGFNPKAYSRKGACGPWQFMYRTGKKYGLRVDRWVDERRDPVKATVAAARYLKDLYDMFKSWHLALASYNAGEGKIKGAIRRYRTEDFWELCKYRYLRKETKNYVPKLIAAALIAKNPEKYGFTGIKYEEPLKFDEVEVNGPISLYVIAKCCGVTVDEIRNLNPELKRDFTPPNRVSYKLRIPYGTKEIFLENFAKIPPRERIGFVEHRIKRGESLWVISRRYGVPIEDIRAINKIKNPRRLRPGRIILIPITKEELKLASTKLDPSLLKFKPKPRRSGFYYRVRKGDSLWLIARRFGTTVRRIKRANGLRRNTIRPGQRLFIPR